MKSLKSRTIVLPYPVTLIPEPTTLISVKPTPILFATTPEAGLVDVDPIPIPPPPSSPQPLPEYPSKEPRVLLNLISPEAGDEFL